MPKRGREVNAIIWMPLICKVCEIQEIHNMYVDSITKVSKQIIGTSYQLRLNELKKLVGENVEKFGTAAKEQADTYGKNLLFYALETRDINCIRNVLKKTGIDVNHKHSKGKSVFDDHISAEITELLESYRVKSYKEDERMQEESEAKKARVDADVAWQEYIDKIPPPIEKLMEGATIGKIFYTKDVS